jgi:hypothetical protein
MSSKDLELVFKFIRTLNIYENITSVERSADCEHNNHSVKNCTPFMKPESSYRIHNIPPMVPIKSDMTSASILPLYSRLILTLSSHLSK